MTVLLKGVKEEIDVKVTAECNSDNGKTVRVPFVITSKKPAQPQRKALLKQIDAGEVEDDAVLDEFLLGWKGLQDSEGSNVEYNADTRAAVLDVPEYYTAIVRGVMEAIVGKSVLSKN